jgi:hypothetical protein
MIAGCAVCSIALGAGAGGAAGAGGGAGAGAGEDEHEHEHEHEREEAAPGNQSILGLSEEQQRVVGIVVERPRAAAVPERIDAFGLVLDATLLIAEAGEKNTAAAALRASSAELTRLRGLFEGGAGASLRMLEAAQAEEAKARAEAASAAARFDLHWRPVAALPPSAQAALLDASATGHTLLVRADLPGLHSFGVLPVRALLDVDGIEVPGKVLGALRQSGEVQNAGLLIEVRNPPAGLGPGARIPIALMSAARAGVALPRGAVFYDESGTFVYKRLAGKPGDEGVKFEPVKVTLLLAYGDGWLVSGVDEDDEIVVHGAGVLWSLQGVGAHAVDDDD